MFLKFLLVLYVISFIVVCFPLLVYVKL